MSECRDRRWHLWGCVVEDERDEDVRITLIVGPTTIPPREVAEHLPEDMPALEYGTSFDQDPETIPVELEGYVQGRWPIGDGP